jgi:hypothetical protein
LSFELHGITGYTPHLPIRYISNPLSATLREEILRERGSEVLYVAIIALLTYRGMGWKEYTIQ